MRVIDRLRDVAAAVTRKRPARLLIDTVTSWSNDNASMLAAALSFYTLFSLAPLLIIMISIASIVFSREAVVGNITARAQEMFGSEGARIILQLINSTQQHTARVVATIGGIVTLILGATGLFLQLQSALNMIWKVPPEQTGGIRGFVKKRFLSFGVVAGSGLLLLAALLAGSVVTAVSRFAAVPLESWGRVNDLLVSFIVVTLLFALIYKTLPQVKIEWKDVWIGAAVTSLLFTFGQYLIGVYIGKSGVRSVYGAAASLVVILLWIYYSSQIILFGAEFTRQYTRWYGSQSVPEG